VLRRVVQDWPRGARLGVAVVAGDTRSSVGATVTDLSGGHGVGFRPRGVALGLAHIRPAIVFCERPIGEHGAAVMLARQEFGCARAALGCASVLAQAQA